MVTEKQKQHLIELYNNFFNAQWSLDRDRIDQEIFDYCDKNNISLYLRQHICKEIKEIYDLKQSEKNIIRIDEERFKNNNKSYFITCRNYWHNMQLAEKMSKIRYLQRTKYKSLVK